MNAPFDEFGPSFAASLNGRPRKGRGEARPYQANRRLPQKPKLDPTKVSYADKPAAGWSPGGTRRA
jgi:hypothetical protein